MFVCGPNMRSNMFCNRWMCSEDDKGALLHIKKLITRVWIAGPILCHAWNSKAWGSPCNPTTSPFCNGWGLFSDGPHSNPSDLGYDALPRWWRNQWGSWVVLEVLHIPVHSICAKRSFWIWMGSVIFPRVDSTNERHAGGKKARGLCISWQRF